MMTPFMRDRLFTALAGTPDVLDRLLASVAPDDPVWDCRPDPERYSLREIVAHLADYEAIFQERILQTRDEDAPTLRPVDRDQLVIDNDYAHSDPRRNLALMRERRGALLMLLRDLGDESWERIATLHAPIGPLTLEQQAVFVGIHDGYHTSQIAQWLAYSDR